MYFCWKYSTFSSYFKLTLFVGDLSLTWMAKIELGVQGTCDLGSPFICQWKTVGSEPPERIWHKKNKKQKQKQNSTQRNATVTIFGCFLALRKPLLATNRVFVDNSLEPFVLRDLVISTPSNNAIFRTTACKFWVEKLKMRWIMKENNPLPGILNFQFTLWGKFSTSDFWHCISRRVCPFPNMANSTAQIAPIFAYRQVIK